MLHYNIEEITKFAHRLADASGDVIRKYYRNFGIVDAKNDLSPVTIADKEAEQTIQKLIKQYYPDHGIQGEEFGIENESSQYKWVIDPIDGTASFMIGRPIFGTLIALLYKEIPVIGIINQPITNERWIGVEDRRTLYNGREVGVRACATISDAVLCTTGPQYFNAEKLVKFNNVLRKAKYGVYGGDCYNYALLSMGMIDAVVESGLKLHDFMAIKIVVEQAGGIATDWQGRQLDINSKGDVVFAGDKKLHREIIELLK